VASLRLPSQLTTTQEVSFLHFTELLRSLGVFLLFKPSSDWAHVEDTSQ